MQAKDCIRQHNTNYVNICNEYVHKFTDSAKSCKLFNIYLFNKIILYKNTFLYFTPQQKKRQQFHLLPTILFSKSDIYSSVSSCTIIIITITPYLWSLSFIHYSRSQVGEISISV